MYEPPFVILPKHIFICTKLSDYIFTTDGPLGDDLKPAHQCDFIWCNWSLCVTAIFSAHRLHYLDLLLTKQNVVSIDSACWIWCKWSMRFHFDSIASYPIAMKSGWCAAGFRVIVDGCVLFELHSKLFFISTQRLSSAPVPFTVLSITGNPCNEDFLAVCGLKVTKALIDLL